MYAFHCSKGGTVHVQADVVFGNDGAHSTIRRQMMTCSLMDVMQSYVPYGYIELPVAKTKHNEASMIRNWIFSPF